MKARQAAALALAVAALAPEARAETMADSVRSVLQDKRYRFCHEDDYPLAPDEHAWCPMVGSISGACPSLPKACKLPPVDRTYAFQWGLGRGRGRHGVRGQVQKGGEPPPPRPPQEDWRRRPEPEVSLPDMSGFARVLFFGMLAVFAVMVARAIVKNLLRSRDEADGKDEPKPGDAPAEAAPAARGPVETDVERLLARARAAAERGEYGRAVDDCHAALLRRLDGDGLIEIHPSRTNGDYVRALGDRPDLEGAVKSVVRDVEGVQFGDTAPSEPLFRSVLARVLPLVSRGLGVALILFGLSAGLSCTPHGGGADDEGRGDTSPSGTEAVLEVMSKHGVKVRRRNEPLSRLDKPLALVLLPEVSLDEAAWKDLLRWVKDKGGRLVVAGMAQLPPELELRIGTDPSETTGLKVARGVHWPGHPDLSLPPGHRIVSTEGPPGPVTTGATSSTAPPEGTVLLRGDSAVVVERTLGEGRVMVVSDDRLFTNAALAVDDDASFVLSLLYRTAVAPDREVEICDAWTGAGAQTPLESVREAKLTPFILQLFVLMALLFLWKGRAFARLRDPPTEARRAFVDHARALGLSYQRAQASRHVTGLYSVWALERLRERVHRSGRQGLIPLAEAIAARTGRPEGEIMAVLVEASGARDEAAPPSSFRPESRRGGAPPRAERGKDGQPDLALMRELMSFLSATGGGGAQLRLRGPGGVGGQAPPDLSGTVGGRAPRPPPPSDPQNPTAR